MGEVILEFEGEVAKISANYDENMEDKLSNLREYKLIHYDHQMAQNSETDVVARYRSDLEHKLDSMIGEAIALNSDKKKRKLLDFEQSVFKLIPSYKLLMQQIVPDAAEETFRNAHETHKKDIISEFDAQTGGFSLLREVRDIRENLLKEISDTHSALKAERDRAALIRTQNRLAPKKKMCEVILEFEGAVAKISANYDENIEDKLSNLRENKLIHYDRQMAQNSETDVVARYRSDLEHKLDRLLGEAIALNSDKKKRKLLDLQQSELKLRQSYKLLMQQKFLPDTTKKTFGNAHKTRKKDIISKFDAQTGGFSLLPEVRDIRENLLKEISGTYSALKAERDRAALIRKRNRLAPEKKMCEVILEFEGAVVKISANYDENIKDKLSKLRRNKLDHYDRQMAHNSETDVVARYRSDLEHKLDSMIGEAIALNSDKKKKKLLDLQQSELKLRQSYKLLMQQTLPDATDETFGNAHKTHKKDIISKFDAQTGGFSLLREVRDIRENLLKEISDRYSALKAERDRAALIRKRNRLAPEKKTCEVILEFEGEVAKISANYDENIEDKLSNSRENKLIHYDRQMAQNSETDVVARYRSDLEHKLDSLIGKAIALNSDKKKRKLLDLQQSVFKLKQSYKLLMQQIFPDATDKTFENAHETHKKDIISKFDAQTGGFSLLREVRDIRENLLKEISDTYSALKAERDRAALIRTQNRLAPERKMYEVFLDFRGKVAKISANYDENIEEKLSKLREKKLIHYDRQMAQNSEADVVARYRSDLEHKLDRLNGEAIALNSDRRELYEARLEAFGRQYGEDFENSLSDTMVRAYIRESCFDAWIERYWSERVLPIIEVHPVWARNKIEETFRSKSASVREQNQNNRDFRSVTVDNSSSWEKFKGKVAEIGKAVGKFLRGLIFGFTS